MYIDPFVAGVLATLLCETLILFIAAGVSAGKKRRNR